VNQLLSRIVALTMGKVLFFGLVLAGAYFFFYTYDTYINLSNKQTGLAGQIAQEKETQKDTDSTLKKELEVKDSVALLSQQYEKIARSLPSVLTQSDIMAFVDIFSKASKVRVTLKKPEGAIKKEIVEELPVVVSLKGTYFQIGQFIREVSIFEPVTRVSNYRIYRDTSPGGNYIFDGKIVGYRSIDIKPEEVKK